MPTAYRIFRLSVVELGFKPTEIKMKEILTKN